MQRPALASGRLVSGLVLVLALAVASGRAQDTPATVEDEPILETQASDVPSEPREQVWSVAYAPDGKTIATAAPSGEKSTAKS